MERQAALFHRHRHHTTEEQNGVDYFFRSKDDFAEMIEQDELLEYAIVYNDYKGIPKQQVREALATGRMSSCGSMSRCVDHPQALS